MQPSDVFPNGEAAAAQLHKEPLAEETPNIRLRFAPAYHYGVLAAWRIERNDARCCADPPAATISSIDNVAQEIWHCKLLCEAGALLDSPQPIEGHLLRVLR
jgi:hypothetical protein